ncbi:helix-turn-helix domain-containing protein [Planomonospora venezuelensis]|uniref:Transcriptional regulator with XRE-family HTH domain n=1 Tax=Planomonospora venezuelensis TaxID=1999 RepID=A0A841D151_PLAVE|nr:helix-turn-helix domain-containing protein [Planomonospora venezuelensis]MBB5962037.1 transcriptional regulator with XRE-family HTH domain [Planomonospora venezuelensis]
MSGLFWEDLQRDLEDPEFLREYVAETVKITAIDEIVNALEEARVSAGLSKADLARAIGAEPATVRRLFSSGNANPTLGTLAVLAAALGLRISMEPLAEADRQAVTEPLRSGCTAEQGIRRVAEMRGGRRWTSIPA